MTVKQLIKKLSKLPEDAKVIIPNADLYVNGYYAATEVDDSFLSEGVVLIDTDYERRVE